VAGRWTGIAFNTHGSAQQDEASLDWRQPGA